MANPRIKITGETKVDRAVNGTIRQLKRLGSATRKMSRGIARSMGGVLKRFTSLRALLVGGAITAGLAKSVKDANSFAQAMGQVDTLLDDGNIKEFTLAVRDLSAETGIAASELSGGLYQALSAGVPPGNAIEFLANASKAAAAGATDVTSAVDIMTTVLNAFKMEADQTARVGDVLFQTVKLGKTTLGELSASLAQVAPLAASSGVSFEQVAAAVATLTKQGAPTSNAVTQIRAAILATNEVLGDGWTKSMSLQEAFKAVEKQSNGSQTALRAMVGRVEAMNGILGLTGKNARGAAGDLASIDKAAGAMDRANDKVQQARHWSRLFQSFKANVLAVGGAIDRGLSPLVEALAAKFRAVAANAGPLAGLATKIKEFAKGAANDLDGIFDKIKNGALTLAAVIKALGNADTRVEVMAGIGGVLKAAILDAMALAGNALMAVAPIIGALIGEAAKSVFFEGAKRAGKIAGMSKALGISKQEARAKLLEQEGKLVAGKFNENANNLAIAVGALAKIVAKERREIEGVFAPVAAAAKVGGGKGGGKQAPKGKITIDDIKSGKVDINDVPDGTTIYDAQGGILASAESFKKAPTPAAPVHTPQGLQSFGDSSKAHMVQRLAAGGGKAGLGFGPHLTRLEDGTGIKDAIKASRTVTKGELGTANNPMTVKLNEEPV